MSSGILFSGYPDDFQFRPPRARCDECGEPVPPLELYQQVVEGGTGIARGHRSCIEAEWGPLDGSDGASEVSE